MKYSITLTPNSSKRTYTIRINYEDGMMVKYRTTPMSKTDFEEFESMTKKDLTNFLNTETGAYYKVKTYYKD